MPNLKATRTDDDRAFDVAVGERIRAFRLAAGLTQTELARRSGVTFQQIQKYETGSNRVAASRLAAIAHAVDAQASALLGEEPAGDHLPLDPQLRRLSAAFQRCSPEAKATLCALANTLAADS